MRRFVSLFCVLLLALTAFQAEAKKKVYVSFILHGNMNYDRYVRPVIWEEFPKIYDNLLSYLDEHPDFKGQVQYSGQSMESLKLAAPQVLEHAMALHRKGQLNFTGTFYSEPVNVNMDGETNFRCAWLGTSIVKDFAGSTDGFYLQERAFHPQLPWIMNHAGVSWIPVITKDGSPGPFKLRGLDGSVSVCVPISRGDILENIRKAADNSLVTVEEDYEIPQAFTTSYQKVAEFNASQDDVEVEWITVKEYIERFGVQAERYIDHTIKASSMEDGTYSRWTSDPLDIRVQDYTNKAMADFRSARILSSLMEYCYGIRTDVAFSDADISLKHDPLAWDIARADLYPEVEPKFLKNEGQVTVLSKAENLLLWAVNSDAKGWYPLYEKRRERVNSFENSSLLSNYVIDKGLDWLSSQIRLKGYDKYFIIGNFEHQRSRLLTLELEQPYDVYEYSTGRQLPSECVREGGKCRICFNADLPSYGYVTIALKRIERASDNAWHEGSSITADGIRISADGQDVTISSNGRECRLSLDSLMLRPLAERTRTDEEKPWREAEPFGEPRISVREGICPQLRIESQPDWLIHMQQTYTIENGKVACDVHFTFPHPTLVRKIGLKSRKRFDPRGLTLLIDTGVGNGTVGYDIPYGISEYDKGGVGYFCPLSTLFYGKSNHWLAVSPQTGEQAFCVDSNTGVISLYMGASTVSGPLSHVGLKFVTPTEVSHIEDWASEVFHGDYDHKIVFFAKDGSWQDAHIPMEFRNCSQPVYIRECIGAKSGKMPARKEFLNLGEPDIDITTMTMNDGKLFLRLNEREGRNAEINLNIGQTSKNIKVQPFGIVSAEYSKN